MKKLLLVAALALTCAGLTASRAHAQSANFVFTPTSSLDVTRGGTFTFSITLNVTTGGALQDVAGLTYFLQQNGSSPFIFSIVGRDTSASQFRFGQFDDAEFSNATPDPMSPSNNNDLGRLTAVNNNLPSGSYFIADVTLQVAGNAPAGSYTIQSVSAGGKTAVFNDSDGETFPIQPGTITVVVPEPSTYALLAVGAIVAGVGVYRRRRMA